MTKIIVFRVDVFRCVKITLCDLSITEIYFTFMLYLENKKTEVPVEMPLQRKSASKDHFVFKKTCKYIGSVAVTHYSNEERQRFVNDKISEVHDQIKGVSVVMMITDEGVKILQEDEKAVRMAHGITRIAFSAYQPDRRIFAYVAKSLTADKKVVIQAHMFRTKKGSHTQQFSTNLTKAFKIAHARDTTCRKNRVNLFESEAAEKHDASQKTERGKKWAKLEMGKGHENATHALKAKGYNASPEMKKIMVESEQGKSNKKIESNIINKKGKNRSNSQSNSTSSNTKSKEILSNSVESIVHLHTYEVIHIGDATSQKFSNPKSSKSSSNPKIPTPINSEVSYDPQKHSSPSNISSTPKTPQSPVSPKPRSQSTTSVEQNQRARRVSWNDANLSGKNIGQRQARKGSKELAYSLPKFTDYNQESDDHVYQNIPGSGFHSDVFVTDENENVKSLSRVDLSRLTITEEDLLKECEWYQPGLSREIAEEIVTNQSVGSFVIRDSHSKPGSYVMTVKVPSECKSTGVANFLIDKSSEGCFKIKGFEPIFPSLFDLVGFYGSYKQDIPCQLLLGSDNPIFMTRLYIDQPDNDSGDQEWSDGEYDDLDYENFMSNDSIIKELEVASQY